MSDMSSTKELSGDILPPSTQHTTVPLGASTDIKTDSTNINNNNL